MNRIPRAELFAGLLLTLSATAALAHATLERKEASPNASYRGVVQITHGCDGQPTNRVSVTIPEGVIGAKPMPKPGWTVTTEKGPYARAYPYFHGDIREGVKTITWTGGSLPDDQVDEFTFLARVSDAFAPGSTVYFPVEQDCTAGQYRWTRDPGRGAGCPRAEIPRPRRAHRGRRRQPGRAGRGIEREGRRSQHRDALDARDARRRQGGGRLRPRHQHRHARPTGSSAPRSRWPGAARSTP